MFETTINLVNVIFAKEREEKLVTDDHYTL